MKEQMKEELGLAQRMPEMFNPFGMMRRFTRDMERLFTDFQGFGTPTFFRTDFLPLPTEFEKIEWLPQIEVLHNDGQFIVRADLPGLTKDDVKVEVLGNLLTLSGERKEEKEEKREGFFRTERTYGTFVRQVPLPEGVKMDKAEAIFRNGVLEIRMPMPKFEKTTHKLEIKEPMEPKAAKATA